MLLTARRTRQGSDRHNSQAAAGFTILELLIASSVFAVILLVVAVGVIRFSNGYYKGITSSKTQATARAIMLDISQAIQFGKSVAVIPAGAGGVGGLCVDNTLYSYKLGQQVTDSAPNTSAHQGYHGLLVTGAGACSGSIPVNLLSALAAPGTPGVPAGSRELLGQHMRLGALSVTGAGGVYTVRVRVIYGDDDLLLPAVSGATNWANEGCSGSAGSQFCAVSDLTTTVEQRLL